MNKKLLKKPVCNRHVEELRTLVKNTMSQLDKTPVFPNWLIYEARGHNMLAEAMVLHGLSGEEAWDFCVTHHGLTKSQDMRRRLQESKEAFSTKRK